MSSEPPDLPELPIIEPIRKPDLFERKSKEHIPRKDEVESYYRRNRKQTPGKVQSGVRYIPDRPGQTRRFFQAQDITEPAYSKPS